MSMGDSIMLPRVKRAAKSPFFYIYGQGRVSVEDGYFRLAGRSLLETVGGHGITIKGKEGAIRLNYAPAAKTKLVPSQEE
jgi:hypothetical protein